MLIRKIFKQHTVWAERWRGTKKKREQTENKKIKSQI
jgi:hypothetical protein